MKQDKKKKRRAPITLVVLVVLVAVVSVELLRAYGQLGSAKTQRDTMGQQLEEQKKENSDLINEIKRLTKGENSLATMISNSKNITSALRILKIFSSDLLLLVFLLIPIHP